MLALSWLNSSSNDRCIGPFQLNGSWTLAAVKSDTLALAMRMPSFAPIDRNTSEPIWVIAPLTSAKLLNWP